MNRQSYFNARILFAACALVLFGGGLETLRAQQEEDDCFKCSPPAHTRRVMAVRQKRAQLAAARAVKERGNALAVIQYPTIYSGNQQPLVTTNVSAASTPASQFGLGLNNDLPAVKSSSSPLTNFDAPLSSSFAGGGAAAGVYPAPDTSRKKSNASIALDVGVSMLSGYLRQRELDKPRREQEAWIKRLEENKRKSQPAGNAGFSNDFMQRVEALKRQQPAPAKTSNPALTNLVRQRLDEYRRQHPPSGNSVLFPKAQPSNRITTLGGQQPLSGITPLGGQQPSNRPSPFGQQSRPSPFGQQLSRPSPFARP